MPRSTLTEDQIRHVEQIAMRYLEKKLSINNKELRGLSGITYDQQYLCQLGKAEGGLRGMNTAQAGDLVENLGK